MVGPIGPFSIPIKVLKLLNPYISKQLAHIFNQSICSGIFPDRLKYAKVIPVHKKGPSANPSNYGPTVQAIRNITCWKPSRIRTNEFEVLRTKTKFVWTNS